MLEAADQLKKKYGLYVTLAMVIGAVVGVGIFLRAPRMALGSGGDVVAIFSAWILAGVMVFPLALLIAEIGGMFARTGGLQIYAQETWGKRLGFSVGWMQTLFYFPANTVALAFLTSEYTLKVVGKEALGLNAVILLSLFYIAVLFFINIFFPRTGGGFQLVTTLIKIVPLLLIGVAGSFYFAEPLNTLGADAERMALFVRNGNLPFLIRISAVVPAAIFALGGSTFVAVIAREVKNPGRNIPLAIVGGLSVVLFLYLLFTFASFRVATPEAFATGGVSTADVGRRLFGNFFGNIMNVFILISALGVTNVIILVSIRAPYAMANEYVFPGSRFLGHLNTKNSMPVISGLVSMTIVVLYLVLPYLLGAASGGGDIYFLFTDAADLSSLIFSAIIGWGIVRMRRTHANLLRPFRAPMIRSLLFLALIGISYGLFSLVSAHLDRPIFVLVFLGFIFLGLWVYKLPAVRDRL